MRKDEVANLRWEDLDFARKVITLQARKADPTRGIQEFQLKSRKTRTIPLKTALGETVRSGEGELQVLASEWCVVALRLPARLGDALAMSRALQTAGRAQYVAWLRGLRGRPFTGALPQSNIAIS